MSTPVVLVYDPSGSLDGTQLCPYLANGTVRKLVTTISGLTHLNGQQVTVVQDGIVSPNNNDFVSGGQIVLDNPGATIHVGLPYTGKVQFLPLGGDGQTVNQGKKRKLFDVLFRLFKSLGGKFGKDEASLYDLNYTTTENINQNSDDETLFTGDFHYVPFESSMLDYWSPIFVQDQPLPSTLLAAIFRSEISEDK